MENPIRQAHSYRAEDYPVDENPWEWWNAFRTICDYNKRLGVALIVSHDVPEMEEVTYRLIFKKLKLFNINMCNVSKLF